MATYEHDPEAVLDYGFRGDVPGPNGRNFLETGETITAVTVTASEGLTLGPARRLPTSPQTACRSSRGSSPPSPAGRRSRSTSPRRRDARTTGAIR